MSRSNWKNLNISKTIIKKIRKKLLKRPVRNKFIFNGSVSIPILFEDMTFYIYNGKMFNSFTVDYLTQNKKFGEFSTTRKPFFFSKKKKKDKDNYVGQTSLPSINRAGYFSYWESSWDNKFKYQFFFIKFLFLERFFPLFFLSKFFCTKNLIYKNNAGLKKKIFFFKNFLYDEEDEDDIEIIDEDTDLIETSSKKFYKFCLSKIWFLKYKNYIIINMYLLSPNTSFKKKNFFYKNTESLNDLDNTFFKKFSLKKFFFKFNYFFFKTLLIQKNEPFIFDKFISFRIKNFFFKNKIINNATNKAIFIKLKDSLKKRNLHNSRSDHFLKKMYNSF